MALDHEAIYSAYSGTVVSIDDSKGAFDKDGKSVTLDNDKVVAARKAIDDAYAAKEYQRKRKEEYPSWEDQLDKIYHSGIDAWKADIKAIKDKYPKP
ncbi:conserved hypothetical protein [Tiamatvirus PSSP7]|uniref:Uncharacterized protein n=2 Tax=Prochlorococcus phage P-SSP7 TaxID=268748 RepID=Q58N19_BPPRP|nr:uncharacterized protein PSSP7_040 [Prochlorococcus phage P-SSP7]AAX44219.1 uncharacterized protein PSSP7_040 [Prochlorococcus phage P-SSP7]ACY76242.1 conserved hypothetical protein [Tiamatvirus PSSP7]